MFYFLYTGQLANVLLSGVLVILLIPNNSNSLALDKMIRNRISSLKKKAGGRHEKATEIWFGSR